MKGGGGGGGIRRCCFHLFLHEHCLDWLKNELAMAPIIPIAHNNGPDAAAQGVSASGRDLLMASLGVNDEARTHANAAIQSSEGILLAQPDPRKKEISEDSSAISDLLPVEPGMAGLDGRSRTLPTHVPDGQPANPSHSHSVC